jgi:hypothetical protein
LNLCTDGFRSNVPRSMVRVNVATGALLMVRMVRTDEKVSRNTDVRAGGQALL